MLLANCQVAALKASEIQYAVKPVLGIGHIHISVTIPIKLAIPHFRACKGIGSRSRFVQRALPAAKADCACCTRTRGREKGIKEEDKSREVAQDRKKSHQKQKR